MTSVFGTLLEAMKQGRTVEIITLVDAPEVYKHHIGQMLLVFPGNHTAGEIINTDITRMIAETVSCRPWKGPTVFEYGELSLRFFWNRTEQKRKAIIAGGGHISLPLTQILSIASFDVTVIDDRPEFANQRRFPQAGRVICEDFTRAFNSVVIDANTAVIIVTRGHRYDIDCLRSVISSEACYLGMIGSRRRIRSILEQMTEEGTDTDLLSRLKAPIGLDIGAQTPEEIAVSIAAEVINCFRGGTGLPLSAKTVNFI